MRSSVKIGLAELGNCKGGRQPQGHARDRQGRDGRPHGPRG